MVQRSKWSESEVALLKEHYPSSDWGIVLASLPCHNRVSIKTKAQKLGIKRLVNTPGIKPNSWSDSEIALLKEHYPVASWSTLLSLLPGRSKQAIRLKSHKLSLFREGYTPRYPNWSSDEDNVLKDNYNSATWCELSELLPGRTIMAINHRAGVLGLRRKVYEWTVEEESHLKKVCSEGATWSQLTQLFPNRSLEALLNKINRMGINLPESTPRSLISLKEWSDSEVQILHEHYPRSPWRFIEELLPGRSKQSIRGKARKLGIKRVKGLKGV